jgi:hypothetical protein
VLGSDACRDKSKKAIQNALLVEASARRPSTKSPGCIWQPPRIYPQRQGELLRRIREGRLCVSPFLCNSLWGFQSVEGALRTFYPARRMEREHGLPIAVAEHIELPSLPWGMASLMAGCGIRWTFVPFLDYDSTFKGLKNLPLFRLEGPDGREVRVLLDACGGITKLD